MTGAYLETCNFAIMPYTNPHTHSVLPMGITSWGSIKVAGTQLMADCLKSGKSSGGEIFVRDSTHVFRVDGNPDEL